MQAADHSLKSQIMLEFWSMFRIVDQLLNTQSFEHKIFHHKIIFEQKTNLQKGLAVSLLQ